MDTDEFPIRVIVSPSQSAYFAGEPFSATITFTNTSKPDAGLSMVQKTTPSSRTHKRASHSISSAPIARPPTSPAGQRVIRTPTSSVSSSPSLVKEKEVEKTRPVRRGLIGKTGEREPKDAEGFQGLIEQRRKKMLKSSSLSLQTDELGVERKRDEGGEDFGYEITKSPTSASPYLQRSFNSPSSPKIPSPLSRSETLPLSASHPHARKNSYMDGQQAIHVNTPLIPLPLQASSSPLSPLSPSSPSPLRKDITTTTNPNTPSFMPFHGPPSASSSSASLASIDSTTSFNSTSSIQSTNNITAYPIPSTPTTSSFSLALDPIAENTSPLSPGSTVSSSSNPTTYAFPPPPSSPIAPRSHPSISVQAATPVKESLGNSDPSNPPQTPQSPTSPTKLRGHGRTKSYSHAAHRPLLNSTLGLGYPSTNPGSPTQTHYPVHGDDVLNARNTVFDDNGDDGTQLILYSYAQLKGTVVLTPLPSSSSSAGSVSSRPSSSVPGTPRTPYTSNPYSPNPNPTSGSSAGQKYGPTPLPPPSFSPKLLHDPEPVQLTPEQTLLLLRSSLLKTSAGAVGGGSMDIGAMTSSLSQTRVHSRKSSLSIDLNNSNLSSSNARAHRRTASASIGGMGMGLLNALFAPLSPGSASTSEMNQGFGGIHPSKSAPNVSSAYTGSTSGAGYVSGRNSGPLSLPNSATSNTTREGDKERMRAVSASSLGGSYGSSSGHGSAGSFGSFGSLSAWLPGSTPTSSSGTGLGLGLGSGGGKENDPEIPLPTFEVPPVMLAVDLALKPGEERSYVYTILLPSNLPPTFRGRTFSFTYELVVGVCRGAGNGPTSSIGNPKDPSGISRAGSRPGGRTVAGGAAAGGGTSKVMRVPIRVYTNVVVGRSPTPYDLLWPVHKRTQSFAPGHRRGGVGRGDLSMSLVAKGRNKGGQKDLYVGKVVEMRKDADKVPHRERAGDIEGEKKDNGLEGLREYAKGLAETPSTARGTISEDAEDCGEGESEDRTMTIGRSVSQTSTVVKDEALGENPNGTAAIGCGEAVEILTRNPKKVSYDVNKDGVKVAVLTFTKAAYRLGETVQGIVELNERTSRTRVVQVSAHLETHETLPTALASHPRPGTPAARQLKRIHAEHHSSFVLSTLRTTFALDIPSDASAAFQVKVGTGEEKATSRVTHRAHSANTTSSSSASLHPHSPLPPNSPMLTAPASAPAYQSTFPSSPSLLSPAFQPSSSGNLLMFPIPQDSKPGGLEWKVRLCLLVAIASEDADTGTEGVRVKGLVRDEFDEYDDFGETGRGGTGRGRGEWGSSWKAVNGVGLEKVRVKNSQQSQNQLERGQNQNQGMVKSWASFFAASILGTGDDTVDENDDSDLMDGWENPPIYDGIKPDRAGGVGVGVEYGNDSKWFGESFLSPSSPTLGEQEGGRKNRKRIRGQWKGLKVETVECEVPIRVWPGNTAYKPVDVVFDV